MQALPWIIAGGLTAGTAVYSHRQQKKAEKQMAQQQKQLTDTLNEQMKQSQAQGAKIKPEIAPPQAGQNKGALGKIRRKSTVITGGGGASGGGGTGVGKGLLY